MKYIKIHIYLFFLFLSSPTLYGQQDSIVETEVWNKHIYEIGEELTSCECNFRNLFQNWEPLFVNNPEIIELLSYKYVETIEHDLSLDYYADLIINHKTMTKGFYTKERISFNILESDSVTVKKIFYLYPRTLEDDINEVADSLKAIAVLDTRKLLAVLKNSFKSNVRIGDKVFLIKMLICGHLYNHYVICRPENNSIIWDEIFSDVPLRLRYYRYKSNYNLHLSQ